MTRGNDVAGGVTGVGSHSGAEKGLKGGIIKRHASERLG